jgi:hypothetical protein
LDLYIYSSHVFMEECLVEHRDNSAFYFSPALKIRIQTSVETASAVIGIKAMGTSSQIRTQGLHNTTETQFLLPL